MKETHRSSNMSSCSGIHLHFMAQIYFYNLNENDFLPQPSMLSAFASLNTVQ